MGEFQTDDFITGNNFAKKSNIIYAQATSVKEISALDENNFSSFQIIDSDICIYSIKNFDLKENDIIFCKTDFVLELFSKLDGIKLYKNIKLITHQAATPSIDKVLFDLKPSCISEWYSINVDHVNENLIPIPLGLANNFSKGNLHPENYLEAYKNKYREKKSDKIYCNFNPSTNIKRSHYLKHVENNKLFDTAKDKVENKEFLEKLLHYKYVLSPQGVGLDTHRFWETLYSGSMPIAENNYIYNKFFSQHYHPFQKIEELELDKLPDNDLETSLAEQLNINFWMSKIRTHEIESLECLSIQENTTSWSKKNNLSKKYTRKQIIKSSFDVLTKFKDLIKTFTSFDEKLINKYWH